MQSNELKPIKSHMFARFKNMHTIVLKYLFKMVQPQKTELTTT